MSKKVNSYTINHKFTTTNPKTNVKGMLDKLVASNERLSLRELEAGGQYTFDCGYRLKYSCLPNIEIQFGTVDNAYHYIVSMACSIDSESMTDLLSTTFYRGDALSTNEVNANITISVVEIDDCALYVCIKSGTKAAVSFLLAPFVNYFTNDRINAVVIGLAGITALSEKASNHTFVPIGGTKYPSGNSIAVPTYLYSYDGYYGYVFDPRFLYRIYNGGTQFSPDFTFKTQLGGYTFEHIGGGFFICLDG